MGNGWDDLALCIIEKAVKDYKTMKRMGVERMKVNKKVVTKKEIEDFFNSTWCDFLIRGMNITGKDILRHLQRD